MANDEKKTSNKTALILYVLEILKKYSDIEHPMDYKEISEKLESDYGITKKAGKETCIDRGTVASYIEIYKSLNYTVKHSPRKGYYIDKNLFSFGEATFLIDSVFASKSLTGKQSIELTKKIANTLSIHQSDAYDYLDDEKCASNVEDADFFKVVEELCSAIMKKKQVCITKKRVPAVNQSKRSEIKVSPYALLPNNNKYFLICYDEKRKTVVNIRVDEIYSVKLNKNDVFPLSQVPGFENGYENYFDDIKYLKEHPFFTKKDNGIVVNALFKLENENDKIILLDWFDKETVQFTTIKNVLYAKVKTSLQSILYCCSQKGTSIELVKPYKARQAVKEYLQKILNKYE